MTRRRRTAACLALVSLLIVGPLAPAALAESPTRTGWWNTASAGTLAAPAPTTASGGLHIGAGAGQTLAYAAVLYPLTAGSTATLTLAIDNQNGSVAVQACPTTTTTWKAGGDQPADSAPEYSCKAIHYPGVVSDDGKTVTFTLAAVTEGTPGLLSLAIVPDDTASSAATFGLDLAKPGARSLTVIGAPPSAPSNQQAPPPPPPTSPGTTSSEHTQAAGQPLAVPHQSVTLPAPQSATAGQPGTAPQVAPSTPAAPTAPDLTAQHTPSSGRGTTGQILGALALLSALLFWGFGRGLLGGRITPLSMPLPTCVAAARKR